MRIPTGLGACALALALVGAASAQQAVAPYSFRHLMSSMENVGTAIIAIGRVANVADVRLVRLDDFSMGVEENEFRVALALQYRRSQLDTLRAAVDDNAPLVAELQRLDISFRTIIAIDVAQSGTITVYTFGGSV